MMEEFKKILCPVDFSEHSIKGLEKSVKLASIANGELTLVHVISDPWSELYNPDSDTLLDPVLAEQKATEMLEALAAKHAPGVTCQCVVRRGEHIYSSICELAGSLYSEIIVMTTHGRSGLKRLMIGSVAEHVIRNAPCSVFVVRSQKGDTLTT